MTEPDNTAPLPVPTGRTGPGRPPKFEDWMPQQAKRLALLGLKDEEIAVAFGVSERTIYYWKAQYPAFLQALNEGRTLADANVAASLYQRAVGMTVYEDKLAHDPKGGQTLTKVAKQLPPDTSAAAHWLALRQRKLWAKPEPGKVLTDPEAPGALEDQSDEELQRRIAEIEARRKAAEGKG